MRSHALADETKTRAISNENACIQRLEFSRGFRMSDTSSTPFPLSVFVGNPNTPGSSAEATFDAENEAFDSLMGTTPAFQNTYIDGSQAPSDWASNAAYFASVSETSPTFAGSIPVIGLPMGSTNPDAPSAAQILENYADGSYDSMLQSMVQSWASDGFKTQYWRPGVEMNLGSTAGYVGSSASMQALWIAAFQHIYTTLHAAASADGVNLKVIWNPGVTNDTTAGNATQTLWPGAQYVDVIGADVYSDAYPYGAGSSQGIYDWDKSGQELNSPNPVYDTSLQQWASDPVNLEHYYTYPASDQYVLDASGGSALSLQDIINFAKAQGKPIAIAETGAGSTGDGTGLSDNPTFVQWLASTLENSGVPVDFVSIWDTNSNGSYEFSNASDDKPLEAAAWAKYFGAHSTSAIGASTTSASASDVTATPTADASSSPDTLALQISEDAGNADAEFTVAVNGQQVGGDYTASTLHSSGDAGTFLLTGDWGSSVNDVQVSFISDANGATPETGQGLYVNSIAYDGETYAGTSATLSAGSSHTFAVGGATPTTSGPADNLTLDLSEDALNGNAEFVLYIDGKAVSTPQQVTALHDENATQAFSFSGNFGAGAHTIGIGFVNDAYEGSPSEDRNLYINGITLNGSDVFSGLKAQDSNGVSIFSVNTTS
jgi:hypothetical protein